MKNNTNKVLTEEVALQLHDLIVPQLYKAEYVDKYSQLDGQTTIEISDYATDRGDGFIPFYKEIIKIKFTVLEYDYYQLLDSIAYKFKIYDRVMEVSEEEDNNDTQYVEFFFKVRLQENKILFDFEVIHGINESSATVCLFAVDIDDIDIALLQVFMPRFFGFVANTDIENKSYIKFEDNLICDK